MKGGNSKKSIKSHSKWVLIWVHLHHLLHSPPPPLPTSSSTPHLLLHSPHPPPLSTPSQAYIPLVTVLLSISEQQFFLTYWHLFLTQVILPNIKVRGWEE